MRLIRHRVGVLGAALATALPVLVAGPQAAGPAHAAAGAGPHTMDERREGQHEKQREEQREEQLTVEERRLAQAVPQEILRRSGFGTVAARFAEGLARTGSYGEAKRYVTREGRALWRRAVDRVQGRGPAGGDLSRDDDRPLYWARLGMTRALKEWNPGFRLTAGRRAALTGALERSSRGQDSIDLPAGKRVLRAVVTGFDPFQLDADARRSNPSGAAALALDGRTLRTASGRLVRVETAVFPVRWADFAQGTVERTLLPHFRPGPRQVDLFTTVSQGRPDRFDVERTNGAWRGGYPDNVRQSRTETVPIPRGVPTVRPQPQWTSTTLPYERIVAARTGPYPVRDNTAVTEIPAGGDAPVERPDGPTPGSAARAGGGGNYLSNEIAYRATLLRDAVGLKAPGGHLHTPVLEFGPGNGDPRTGTVSDPVFVRNRIAITGQVREVLKVASAEPSPARLSARQSAEPLSVAAGMMAP
ncbi:pyroglutamyl peptidase [Streptomyces sp. MST-110588]|uniref:pyroglutamyl peptidase n=1 Tax=Streptomyces sp. MST-110588 TaxID=2833628 RepID=UPI001F5D616B|nr:pyroglutamyl peptidase [Streptomyces sp. MST-110588]UNO42239.1 pyroglutamyl peptidase [Streptomyces sp. MST-110588]